MAGPPARNAVARARWRLGGLIVVLALAGLGLLVALALNAEDLGDRLDELGLLAAPALVLGGAMLIAGMVPASLVAGAAGYALGTSAGFAAAIAAATAGALLCALIARQAGTPAARHAFGERVTRLIPWFEARPLRTVAASRLLPGMPFNATSYVLGLTRIGRRDIAVGTAVGFAPRCLAYVALGGSLRDLDAPEARVALVASVMLLVLLVAVPRLTMRAAEFPTAAEDRSDG
jgi:uncharacterized membrane protein YdjX (TVP38/TMEM64 family)